MTHASPGYTDADVEREMLFWKKHGPGFLVNQFIVMDFDGVPVDNEFCEECSVDKRSYFGFVSQFNTSSFTGHDVLESTELSARSFVIIPQNHNPSELLESHACDILLYR